MIPLQIIKTVQNSREYLVSNPGAMRRLVFHGTALCRLKTLARVTSIPTVILPSRGTLFIEMARVLVL
jgi:hypothetical protein